MPRILIAECKQEVSSFNPQPSGYEDFHIQHGASLLTHHRGVREEVGGALSVWDADPSVQLVPTCGARAKAQLKRGGAYAQLSTDAVLR